MKPAKTFERPITDVDVAERLAEVVAEVTDKRGRAPAHASARIVGKRIRVTVHMNNRTLQ